MMPKEESGATSVWFIRCRQIEEVAWLTQKVIYLFIFPCTDHFFLFSKENMYFITDQAEQTCFTQYMSWHGPLSVTVQSVL